MRYALFTVLVVFALVLPAAAQEPGHVEVFAGYSYLRLHPGGVNMNGAEASVSYGIFRHLAVEGSVAGHFGSKSDGPGIRSGVPLGVGLIGLNGQSYLSHVDHYEFLVGPRVSAKKEGLTLYAHALFGAARESLANDLAGFDDTMDYPPGVPPFAYTRTERDTFSGFATAVGGGIDVRLSDRVSFRAAQADYLRTHLANDTQDTFRISTGLVFKF